MDNARPISRDAWLSLALGVACVVAGIVMIVLGWPEQTPWQTSLLQLSGVMFALAVATAIWHMVRDRRLMSNPTPRFRLVRALTIVGVALGAVCYVIAFTTGRFNLAPLGQFFIWLGLGAMFAYLAAGSIRRELHERVTWTDVDDAAPLSVLGDGSAEPAPRRAATPPPD